jgi:signal transduction histidine kinase
MRQLQLAAVLLTLWASSVQAAGQDSGPGRGPARPASPPGQRSAVLVIFGDDASQPWIQPMSDGISRVLYGRGADSPDAYYEYLDAVRFPGPAHRDLFRDTIRRKYRDIRFTLVVPVAGSAIRFVDDARDDLWPGAPVLFIRYNASQPVGVPVREHDAVLGFEFSLPAALQTMKAIVPRTTHLAVAWDEDMAGPGQTADAAAEFRRAGLQTIDLNGLPLAELTARLGRLPEHAVVFLGVSSGRLDSGHAMNTAWPLCEAASSAANRPTFMLGSHFLGCGVIGGLLRDFNQIGRIAGERVLSTLAGRQPREETIPLAAFTELAFDWRQLRRWNIDERGLPRGSVVRFSQPSLWRDYRTPVFAAAGTIGALVALVGWLLYERRQRHKAESDSRRSLAMAAHADRAVMMTAMTGSIGHELSQPLGSIRLNADTADRLIASNRATPEELRDILRDIGREDERATQIVDRVRAMLKKQEIDKRPLDVGAVVRESVAFLAHDATARRVQIDCRLPSAPCFVLGDQVMLQQVVVNLVLNAFEAMTGVGSSADRRVVIEAVHGSAVVEITVRDSGPGVPAHLNGRLFQPYVTTKPNGLGLGLSIVSSIVAAHGGTIGSHNAADGGAVFCITLPHTQTDPRADVSLTPSARQLSSKPNR